MKERKLLRNCILVFALVMSIFFAMSSVSATWWNEDFDYREEINISNLGSTDLTDFPVYINVTFKNEMQSDYDDLRFVNGSCGLASPTELDYQIEYNDSAHAVVWVELPIHYASGSQICMYYGNTTTSTTEDNEGTWRSDYALVYHMDSAGNDSTTNNRDRVSDLGTPQTNDTFLGNGMYYDGVNDAWSLQDIAYLEAQWSERSHEVVFETSNDVTTRQVVFAEGGAVNGIMMYIVSGRLHARWWSESQGWSGDDINVTITNNTIYHATMSYENGGEYALYLNGVKIDNRSASFIINAHSGNGGVAYTGGNTKDFHDLLNSAGHYFDGNIFEWRVYDTAESDDWVNNSAAVIVANNNTISYGVQERIPLNVTVTITSPSVLATHQIQQNETIEVNGTISCNAKSSFSCGNITSYAQFNLTPTSFGTIATSSSLPMWTTSAQPQYCYLNGTQSCNVSWIINLTGTPGVEHKIRINISSNDTTVDRFQSENLTVKIINGNAVAFNQSVLAMGSFFKNTGDRTRDLTVDSVFGNNTNILVGCQEGDCNRITQNWSNGTNQNEGISGGIQFTCSDNTVGSFWALFNVTSDEFIGSNTVNVSCTVQRIFGPINTTILTPQVNAVTNVAQNRSFRLNATVDCTGTCGNITAYALYNFSDVYGDGSDGDLVVSSANTVVNNYTYLTGNELTGDDVITVNSVSEFSVGDEIFIIQMQNGTGSGTAGRYEYALIKNISGSTFGLEEGLNNSFYSGTFNASVSTVTQVVRVPHYNTLTVTGAGSLVAPAWDGDSGGIVIFKVKNELNTTGYINVSDKGYRGGDCNGCGDNANGDQGESYSGLGDVGNNNQSRNDIGGGGGYGPTGFGGEAGGGGGYATVGGNSQGSFVATGGNTVGTANLETLFFGGGAGAGGDNDNLAPFAENVDGGGVAIIFAKTILNARIHSVGEQGIISQNNGGTTGAGAGGTIWLISDDMTLVDVNASGNDEVVGFGGDVGGAGGDGRIRLDYNSLSGTSDPVAGFTTSADPGLNQISTNTSALPAYIITGTQPQNCTVAEDGSCSFEWEINATGAIGENFTFMVYAESNYSEISANFSANGTINITDNVIPTIILHEPANNSIVISNETVNFIWFVDDDDSTVNCNFYLDGVFNQTVNCTTGVNTTLSLDIDTTGDHTWFVNVNDTLNNTVNSSQYTFLLIRGKNISVKKAVESLSTNNMYLVTLNITNLMNFTVDLALYDFVDTPEFAFGSFNTLYDFNFSTNGTDFNGTVLGWNLSLLVNESEIINYSVIGTGDYNLLTKYLTSVE